MNLNARFKCSLPFTHIDTAGCVCVFDRVSEMRRGQIESRSTIIVFLLGNHFQRYFPERLAIQMDSFFHRMHMAFECLVFFVAAVFASLIERNIWGAFSVTLISSFLFFLFSVAFGRCSGRFGEKASRYEQKRSFS